MSQSPSGGPTISNRRTSGIQEAHTLNVTPLIYLRWLRRCNLVHASQIHYTTRTLDLLNLVAVQRFLLEVTSKVQDFIRGSLTS
jgi:hypothetical protein